MRRYAGWGCVILVVLFLSHPWLLGLPGRIASIRFANGLHVGMSQDQVQLLEDKIESRSAQEDMNYGPEAPRDVNFATWGTLCVTRGIQYILYYDETQHLTSWKIRDWGDSC